MAALTPAQAVAYVETTYNEGLNPIPSGSASGAYSTFATLLAAAGWSDAKIKKYLGGPGLLKRVAGSAAQGTIVIPGTVTAVLSGADAAAVNAATGATAAAAGVGATEAGVGATEAGVAGGEAAVGAGEAATALTSAAAIAAIWTAVSNPQMWLRALEILGGVVLVYMALKSLTGVSTPSMATVAKAAAA